MESIQALALLADPLKSCGHPRRSLDSFAEDVLVDMLTGVTGDSGGSS